MIDYLIAKFYEKMERTNDSNPINRTISYMTIVYISLQFSILLPLFIFIERIFKKYNNHFDTNIEIVIYVVLALATPFGLYYKLVYKNKLETIVNKHKSYRPNKFLNNLLFIFAPLFIFCIGPTVTVLMFGGTMFQKEYSGILTPFLN